MVLNMLSTRGDLTLVRNLRTIFYQKSVFSTIWAKQCRLQKFISPIPIFIEKTISAAVHFVIKESLSRLQLSAAAAAAAAAVCGTK